MSPRDAARAINAGRIALGVSLVLAPRRTARGWIGADADRPGTTVIARAHGVRDALLGAIALHTIDSPGVGPRHQRALALCDAVDFAATVAARRALPRAGAGVALLAAAGMVGQLWVARGLSSTGSPDG